MLNVHDLEIRHQKYKRKTYMPYVTLFLSLSTISIFLVYVLFYYKPVTIADTDTLKNLETIIKEKENIDDNKTKNELVTAKNEVQKLSPSLDFIGKMKNDTTIYNKKETQIEYKSKKTPVKIKSVVKEHKSQINIKREHEYDDIRHVIKRFNVNHNPALSLFIAKRYYKLGKYDQAYNYALITNGLNTDIEDSWIVFAKSLVKLNQKDKAIKILTQYVKQSYSSQAQTLLDEILSGKFK